MVRVYMSGGTEDEIEKGIEKWSLAKFDVPARDDGKVATVFERHSIYLEISEIARGASISRVTTIVLEMAKEGIDQDDNVEYDKLCYYFDWATNPVFVVGFFKTKGWSDEKGQWNPSYRPLRSIDVPLSKVLKALTEAHASEFRRIWGGEASHKV